jgi:hypothetical protein
MDKLDNILIQKRLRWPGHLLRMENCRISKQAAQWTPVDGRKKRGRPRKNWKSTKVDYLKNMIMIEMMPKHRMMWYAYSPTMYSPTMCCRHGEELSKGMQ